MAKTIDIAPRVGVSMEKNFVSTLNAIESQIRANGKSLKKLKEEYEENDKAAKNLSDRQNVLQSSISAGKQKVKALTGEYERQKQELDRLEINLDSVKQMYGENSAEALKAEKAYMRQATEVNNLAGKISTAEGQIAGFNRELEENATQLYEAQSKAKAYGDTLERVGDKITPIGDKLSKAGTALTIGVTTPLLAAGTASGKMAVDFEDSMAEINTLLDDTKNLNLYEEAVKRLSSETGKDLGTMGSGMYQAISSLGDGGAEIVKIFDTMAKSSKAGGAEVADSVALISAGMKGYNQVDGETAKKISDLAFQTAKLGVTTFPEMAKSMQPLFPLANSLNISYEELFGTMATLTGVTGNTAEVSTQMKAVFTALMKPTGDMQELLEKYGYSNGQAMIESKGLTGVLAILKEETGGQSDKLGKLLSSTEAITAVTALSGSQFDTFREKLGAMSDATGATETAYEKLNTKGDKLRKTVNNVKIAAVEFGKEMLPAIMPLLEEATKLLKKVSELDDEEKKLIIRTAGVAAAAGPVLNVGGKVISTLGKASSGTGKLIKDIGKLHAAKKGAASVGMLGTEATKAVTGVSGLSRALTALASPAGLLGTVVAGSVVAVGVRIKEHYDWATKSIQDAQKAAGKSEATFAGLATSMNEAREQKIKDISAADEETGKIRALWEELHNLVDENGKVTESNQSRVDYITGELNDALGTQLNLEGDVLQNYKDQQAEIDKLIYKKQAQMKLDAAQGEYNAAQETVETGRETQKELLPKLREAEETLKKSEAAYKKAKEETGLAMVGGLEEEVGRDREAYLILKRQYDENVGVIAGASEKIKNIEKAQEEFEAGHYGIIDNLLKKQTLSYTAAGNASKDTLAKQAQEATEEMNSLRDLLEQGVAGVTEDMVEESEKLAIKATQEYQKAGGKAGDGYIIGLTEKGEPIYKSAKELSAKAVQGVNISKGELQAAFGKMGLEASGALIDKMYEAQPRARQEILNLIMTMIETGDVNKESLTEFFAGLGIDAPEGLINSMVGMQNDVLLEAMDLIAQLGKAAEQEKPKLLEKLRALGVNIGTEANTAMGTALSSTNLKSPKIDPASTIDSAIAAGAQAVLELQKTLDQHPAKIRLVTESVNVGLDVGINALQKHAAGGIFSAPHVAMVAEEAPGEAIIPLSPARRDSAIELLNETAALLGYDHYEYAASMGRGRGDRIRQNNERPAEEAQITTYKIEEGAVQTTIHTAAQNPEEVYRFMKRQLTRDVNKAVRGKGR